MAFNISDGLIRIYQDGIDSIIDQLGKKVVLVMPQKEELCPNCWYDGRMKRSSGRYKANNPNPIGPLNKPFQNGQICPVCQGRGKIDDGTKKQIEIKATVKWSPKEFINYENGKVIIPTNVCKIKTYATKANDINNAVEILVAADEPTENAPLLHKCRLHQEIIARGLRYNRYVEAYLIRTT